MRLIFLSWQLKKVKAGDEEGEEKWTEDDDKNTAEDKGKNENKEKSNEASEEQENCMYCNIAWLTSFLLRYKFP